MAADQLRLDHVVELPDGGRAERGRCRLQIETEQGVRLLHQSARVSLEAGNLDAAEKSAVEAMVYDWNCEQAYELTSAEWVLERRVVEATARLAARVRITVYSSALLAGGPQRHPERRRSVKQERPPTATKANRVTPKRPSRRRG